ncbi:MAG: GatB/YqeY domain-containing protein [Syntrophales bacterium]|jgi:uncharacterized protein YqeY|nr:GatB/YqeY domain-containing protein [Syntrophales bacterium]MDY0043386.1 GatB/YqeY domain-containing protein [Syntrophales bacterium]
MNIDQKLDAEMKEAAKARDRVKLSTIRLMKTAIHNKEIDLKKKLNEQELLQVFSSMVKQRNDSIEQFDKGNRPELADVERREIEIIKRFMPEEMTETELQDEIGKAIEKVGASGMRDMGNVMKELMPVITGKADGKVVSEMVRKKLSS